MSDDERRREILEGLRFQYADPAAAFFAGARDAYADCARFLAGGEAEDGSPLRLARLFAVAIRERANERLAYSGEEPLRDGDP